MGICEIGSYLVANATRDSDVQQGLFSNAILWSGVPFYMVVAQGVDSLLSNLHCITGKEGNFLVRLSSSEENKYALSLW